MEDHFAVDSDVASVMARICLMTLLSRGSGITGTAMFSRIPSSFFFFTQISQSHWPSEFMFTEIFNKC